MKRLDLDMEYLLYALGITAAGFIYNRYGSEEILPNSIPSLKDLELQIVELRKRKKDFLLKNNENFFNTIHEYELTQEQRNVVINDSNSSLVIASAGSGKTSTLIAKYLYLIKQLKIKPEQVLILAFSKPIQLEIKEKILARGITAEVKTFHGLGKEIIEFNNGSKFSLGKIAKEDESKLLTTENMQKCIEKRLRLTMLN